MSIDHISWKTNLERTTDIRVMEFADQIYLYERREVTRSLNGKVPEQPAMVFVQGVVDRASVEAIKLGRFDEVEPFDPTRGEKPGKRYVPLMISAKGLEVIRTEGHPYAHPKVIEKLTQSGDLVQKGGASFIDLFQNGFTSKNIFFGSISDHSIVDLRGTPISVPYRFSYLDGLSSEYYDIDRVLEVVANNPEVEVHRQYGTAKHVLPNYDDADAPTRYGATITWRPTSESWARLLAGAAEKGLETKFVSFRSYDLLKTHDVLGIVSAGCSVEPEVEASGFKL